MIDLHCHILPGIDDGAPDLSMSLEMAHALVEDGVSVVACTPHILAGLYHNTGPQICAAVEQLQAELDERGVLLKLVTGADNHMVPDFVKALDARRLLPLGNSRYVLVEPPHNTAPPRMEEFFFDLLARGYVPILTHPERLSWINSLYPTLQRLADTGVWMQVTAGSLTGSFGRNAQYWAERMLEEGRVHILATDAHDSKRRPPNLARGRDLAAARVGVIEAEHLVVTRPRGVLLNVAPIEIASPAGVPAGSSTSAREAVENERTGMRGPDGRPHHPLGQRLRRLFK